MYEEVIAKNLLLSNSCKNCAWFDSISCIAPERLKDDHVKWISKVIPDEQICEWWRINNA